MDKELQEFWEACGFTRYRKWTGGEDGWKAPFGVDYLVHYYGGRNFPELPELTLDNLFKYAVPLACNYSNEDNMLVIKGQGKDTEPDYDDDGAWWTVEISGETAEHKCESEDKDPTQALYQALRKVLVK